MRQGEGGSGLLTLPGYTDGSAALGEGSGAGLRGWTEDRLLRLREADPHTQPRHGHGGQVQVQVNTEGA